MNILSLHIPKTGGTTLLHLLKRHSDFEVQEDFKDLPVHLPRALVIARARIHNLFIGNEVRSSNGNPICIHGHFIALKYRKYLAATTTVSFACVRHPIDRLMSHFTYWQSHQPGRFHFLHKKMKSENWSFMTFAMRPEMKNLQSFFFTGFDSQEFTYIALFDTLKVDVSDFFLKFLNIELEDLPRLNPGEKNLIEISDLDRSKLELFHYSDFELYNTWCMKKSFSRLHE